MPHVESIRRFQSTFALAFGPGVIAGSIIFLAFGRFDLLSTLGIFFGSHNIARRASAATVVELLELLYAPKLIIHGFLVHECGAYA